MTVYSSGMKSATACSRCSTGATRKWPTTDEKLLARGSARAALTAIATAYCAGLALALIPLETSDHFGGYRVFGLVTYAGAGLFWATFGAIVARKQPSGGRG